jgi:hypothetical protein
MLNEELVFDVPCPHCQQFTTVDLCERSEFAEMRKGGRWLHIKKTCECCNKRMSIWFDVKNETAYASWVLSAGKPRVK